MKKHGIKRTVAAFALLAGFGLAGSAFGQADVIVGDITGPSNSNGIGPRLYGSSGGKIAYSIGTTSCNAGNVNLNWVANGLNHPVIGQNIYRIKDGRFDQIGMSWLKHGFCALQMTVCGSCQPAGAGCPQALGPGCSDPYSSSLNGSQSGLGPKSEVNANTGVYQWPYGSGSGFGVLFKRIQVLHDDLNPALNAGALYVGEGHYVARDDALAGNQNNNASYRMITVGNAVGSSYNLVWNGGTVREAPAIQAWQDNDPNVDLIPVADPDGGRFWAGVNVVDNGDGTWTYNYAIHNLNSERSGGSLTVPIPSGVTVTNMGFHDVDYHSGEPFDPTDWTMSASAGKVKWTSPESFAQNVNSNALRWGSTYTFWFTADTAPVMGSTTLGLFKTMTGESISISQVVPDASACLVDIDGSGTVDVLDFFAFIVAFNNGDPAADLDGSGTIDVLDFFAFIVLFDAGCP